MLFDDIVAMVTSCIQWLPVFIFRWWCRYRCLLNILWW